MIIVPYKLTRELLAPYFIADPKNGEIISRRTGKSIGWCDRGGYWSFNLPEKILGKGKQVLRSRIIWIMCNGKIPIDRQIYHIDADKTNDKISNLRLVCRTLTQLNPNAKLRINNTSGKTGVSYIHSLKKWRARIVKKDKYLSRYFKREEQAIKQRILWESKLGV